MPRGDGTGPWGTFRNCVPQGVMVPAGQMYGRGRGFGRGRFRLTGQPVQAPAMTPNAEPPAQPVDRISKLENRLTGLESELKEIKALISKE